MITLFRYCRIKAKEIKPKLALYSFLEENIKELSSHKVALQKTLILELAEIPCSTDDTEDPSQRR